MFHAFKNIEHFLSLELIKSILFSSTELTFQPSNEVTCFMWVLFEYFRWPISRCYSIFFCIQGSKSMLEDTLFFVCLSRLLRTNSNGMRISYNIGVSKGEVPGSVVHHFTRDSQDSVLIFWMNSAGNGYLLRC